MTAARHLSAALVPASWGCIGWLRRFGMPQSVHVAAMSVVASAGLALRANKSSTTAKYSQPLRVLMWVMSSDTQARPTVAAIDSGDHAVQCLNESDWPLVAKFHGDYPSIAIENTDADTELKQQDERMRHVLAETGQHFGRVFVGYSGRDTAVMDAVTSVLR
jgi:hypothetical protein